MVINWQTTDDIILQTLGERLQALRIAMGYSQKKLADACGVSIPVIGRMESGDGGVKFATWIDALRVLGQLQKLNLLLPDPDEMSPYDLDSATQPKRQRAPRSDRKVKTKKWKWGE